MKTHPTISMVVLETIEESLLLLIKSNVGNRYVSATNDGIYDMKHYFCKYCAASYFYDGYIANIEHKPGCGFVNKITEVENFLKEQRDLHENNLFK